MNIFLSDYPTTKYSILTKTTKTKTTFTHPSHFVRAGFCILCLPLTHSFTLIANQKKSTTSVILKENCQSLCIKIGLFWSEKEKHSAPKMSGRIWKFKEFLRKYFRIQYQYVIVELLSLQVYQIRTVPGEILDEGNHNKWMGAKSNCENYKR